MSAPGLLQDWDLPRHAQLAISAYVTMVNTGNTELIALARRNMENRINITTDHALAETWWQCQENARRRKYQRQWTQVCDLLGVILLLLSLAVFVWWRLP